MDFDRQATRCSGDFHQFVILLMVPSCYVFLSVREMWVIVNLYYGAFNFVL